MLAAPMHRSRMTAPSPGNPHQASRRAPDQGAKVWGEIGLTLIVLAFLAIQALVGGTRLVFSLPSAGLLAIAGFLAFFFMRKNSGRPQISCLAVTIAGFTYLLGRAAFSPIPYLARSDLFSMLSCLLVYLLVAFYFVEPRPRLILVGTLLVLAVAQTAVGVFQFAEGQDLMLFGFIRPEQGSRASGFLISPNHFAGFLEIVGVFGLSLVWWSRLGPKLKVLIGYATLCCYAGIAFSGSRGSYLSATVSLLAWGLLTVYLAELKKPGRFLRTVLLLASLFIVLLGVISIIIRSSPELMARWESMAGTDVRPENWAAALDQARLSPLTGTGAGTHLYYGRLFRRPSLPLDPIHAHSDYLEAFAEYGGLGLAGLLLIVLVHLRSGLRAISRPAQYAGVVPKEGSNKLALSVGAISAVAALAAHSVVDFNLHIPGNALTMAFVFGLLASPGGFVRSAPETRVNMLIWQLGRWSVPTLAMLVLALGGPIFPGEFFTERARIRLRDENAPKAEKNALHALESDRKNPWTYLYLGGAYRLQARDLSPSPEKSALLEKAIAAFEQGRVIFPQDETLLVRLGQTYDQLGRFSEAETAFQEAMRWDPRLEVLRQYYASHQRRLPDPQKSASEKR